MYTYISVHFKENTRIYKVRALHFWLYKEKMQSDIPEVVTCRIIDRSTIWFVLVDNEAGSSHRFRWIFRFVDT